MRKIIPAGAVLALVLLAQISGCTWTPWTPPGPEVTEEFEGEYEAGADTSLRVSNIAGQVDIRGWEGDVVILKAVKRSRYGEDELRKTEITVTGEGGDLIEIRSEFSGLTAPRTSVDMEILVPHNVSLESAETVNGEIKISDITGDTEASCSNGAITMEDVRGYVKADTVNGRIDITNTTGVGDLEVTNGKISAEILEIREDIQIRTVNGGITAYLIPTLNADIELRTTNGRVSVSGLDLDQTTTEANHITGILGTGGSRIDIKTTNGDVDLRKLAI